MLLFKGKCCISYLLLLTLHTDDYDSFLEYDDDSDDEHSEYEENIHANGERSMDVSAAESKSVQKVRGRRLFLSVMRFCVAYQLIFQSSVLNVINLVNC